MQKTHRPLPDISACTLKHLCSEDKQKVAKLIRQVLAFSMQAKPLPTCVNRQCKDSGCSSHVGFDSACKRNSGVVSGVES